MTEMQGQIAADIRGWDAIEDHRTGTEGDAATSKWLADLAREAGATPEVQTFPFQRWVLGACSVSADGHHAEGVPLFDGGITGSAAVEGTLAPLANGNAGIGVGQIGNAAPAGANERFAHARAAGNCPALVAVAAMDADVPGLALQNADRFVDPFGPPVLQVASEEGNWLLGAAARGESASVVVDVALAPATAGNVVARIAGRDPSLAPVVVMTPKSAWWTCTAERGGGIVIWLALLRHFAANQPRRTVVFTANTGPRTGPHGPGSLHAGNPRAPAGRPPVDPPRRQLRGKGLGAPPANLGRWPAGTGRTIHGCARRPTAVHPFPRRASLRRSPATSTTPAAATCLGSGSNRWFHHPTDRWPHTIDLDAASRLTQAMLEIASAVAND